MQHIKIVKDTYIFELSNEFFTLSSPAGGKIAKFPLSARLVLSDGTVCEASGTPVLENDRITLQYEQLPDVLESAVLTLQFDGDEIVAEFSAKAAQDFAVYEFEYLRLGKRGMAMNDCEFRFSPAPRSANGHGTTLYKAPCNCSIDDCYFAPPPFLMMHGNRFGNIAFSLLDLPDSTNVMMSEKSGILAERPAGHLVTAKGSTYHPPRLMITFPHTEWDALEQYYQKLQEKDLIHPIPIEEKHFPDWWKRFFVVSYGDQITQLQYNVWTDDDWDSPEYTTDWLYRWLDNAHKRLGTKDFNIIIDAFWQHRWSIDPCADKVRFPKLREFIDYAHAQGHKVLLWIVPFTPDVRDHLAADEQTMAEKYQVTKQGKGGQYYSNRTTFVTVDYTHDNIPAYMEEYCRILFGNEPDCFDADGVKIDGPFCVSNPAGVVAYAHPEKGIGAKELLLFYKLFTEKAHGVKPDVIINTSTANPFFENYVHINRLGDQSVRSEREDRARITSLISPNMLIDSDGIINSAHIKEDYLTAVVYSTPFLYNTDEFMIGERPADDTMQALGRLLTLSAKKPWGRPVFESFGNWRWETHGRTTAACFDADTVVVFSETGTGYLFSWTSGNHTVPLFGWHLCEDPGAVEINMYLDAGKIYTFRFE